MLSFTAEVFFSLLGQYNRDIWPAQVAGLLLGLGALVVACRPVPGGGRVVAAVLATAWLWTGIVFHGGYLATISFAAPVVAACFAGQAVLLLWRGVACGRLRFRFRRDLAGWSGLVVALAGLAAYPLLGPMAGRGWTQLAMFGAAPCPTVIVTVGLLLLAEGRPPLTLMIIPLLWSLAAGTAAWFLAIPDILALPAIVLAGLALYATRARRRSPGTPPPGTPSGCGCGRRRAGRAG